MESYASALGAVRDVLGIYAPNPDLVAESIELEQAVRSAVEAARHDGLSRHRVLADLDGVVTVAIPDDKLGGASVTHIVRKWATEA